MKNKIRLLLLLSLFVTISGAAQDADKLPMITVTGTYEVQVAPDEVNFSLDVTKTDKDLQIAKRLNDEAVGKILELTKRFNVQPNNVKTDAISVSMQYETVRDPKNRVVDEDGDVVGKRVFRGYRVSKTVIVKLTEIARFEDFFAEALKTGVTEVNSVDFETSKFRENRVQAREGAIKVARDKAVAMAAAINQTIGKAVFIREGAGSNNIDFSNGVGISANGNRGRSSNFSIGNLENVSTTTFAPGVITVEATVTINFLLN